MIKALRCSINVVFPEPVGPIIEIASPSFIVTETLFNTFMYVGNFLLYSLLIFSTLIFIKSPIILFHHMWVLYP
ncbi:Uncharacterised protein [Chlamydia trachomatis]|nr:Uncharacterised protein [Chlamydia trachomatis]